MASAAISIPAVYAQPDITTECGVVYCSQTFEDFLINCTTCSREFSLFNSSLFIRHVKECVGNRTPANHITTEYAIENIFTPAPTDNVDDEDISFDPLLSMKMEIETFDDVEHLSDYKDEDDLTINKIAQRTVTEGIINEYKRHPLLWDNNMVMKTQSQDKRNRHYNEIKETVNSKFKTNFTQTDIRNEILRLKDGYKRALKQPNLGMNPKLWYFDKIAFIDDTVDHVVQNEQLWQAEHSGSEEFLDSRCKLYGRPMILDIIEQYKKYSFLWDPSDLHYKKRHERKMAVYGEIAKFIYEKHKVNYTEQGIKQKIERLRSSYKRATSKNKKFNSPIGLWYYDQLSFAFDRKFIDEENNSQALEEPIIDHLTAEEFKAEHSSIELSNDQSLGESENNEMFEENENSDNDYNVDGSLKGERGGECLKDKNIVLSLIEEYKKRSSLWNCESYNASSRAYRHREKRAITAIINDKFKKQFTDKQITTKIAQLKFTYLRTLRKKEAFEKDPSNANKVFTTDLFYFDKLSFIRAKSHNAQESCDVRTPSITKRERRESKKTYNNSDINIKYEEESDDTAVDVADVAKPYEGKITDNVELLTSIIEEYKKHPCLWSSKHYAKENAIRKYANDNIAHAVNIKFGTTFTPSSVSIAIRAVCRTYMHILRKKQENPAYNPKIWYAELLSFIVNERGAPKGDGKISEAPTKNDEELSLLKTEPSFELDESQAYPILKENQRFEDSEYDIDGTEINNRNLSLSIIEEYKQHPCLWNIDESNANSPTIRSSASRSITRAINVKFNSCFTETEIQNKFASLSDNYMRTLKLKENFEKDPRNANNSFPKNMYYFDNISYIGTTLVAPMDFTNQRSGRKNDNDVILIENECDEQSDDTMVSKAKSKITDNVELITCIIDEYKKHPCLWSTKHYSKAKIIRKRAYEMMCKEIDARFNIKYSCGQLGDQIHNLRSSYWKMLLRKQDNPYYITKIWYANRLSFIENNDEEGEEESNEHVRLQGDFELNSEDDDNGTDSQSEITFSGRLFRKRSKLKTKKDVLKLIELYKAEPGLWNTNHPSFNIRKDRKKYFDNLHTTLTKQLGYKLTAEQLRYQIRYLRESYFRNLRRNARTQESDPNKFQPKPFFYDRLAFLEPFYSVKPATSPLLQVDAKIDPTQDFSYLTENHSLMNNFIELYQELGCLWNQKHKDMHNPTAESEAYDQLLKMFLENGIVLTREQVTSAISFLHATVVSTQKSLESDDINEMGKDPAWFYVNLEFLGKIPRVIDKYCTHCNQEFRTLIAYERHKIEIAGEMPYKCTICGKNFISRSKYHYHLLTHRRPYKCDLCDFQAAEKNNYQVHMMRHKGIMPYACEICDKRCVTSSELSRHMQMHTGEKPIICDICGTKYASRGMLSAHMKRHRNQRDHKCELCSKAYFSPKALQEHMTAHTNERRHICATCGSAFKRKKTLFQHEALHSEKKKHSCKICGKLFAQKAGVYSHMKSHSLVVGDS